MASRPLTDAYTGHDTFIPYLLNRSTSALNADFQTLLRSHDLTLLHWRVLAFLNETDGLGVSTLAQYTDVDQTTLSRALVVMENAGHLSRQADPLDQRQRRRQVPPPARRQDRVRSPPPRHTAVLQRERRRRTGRRAEPGSRRPAPSRSHRSRRHRPSSTGSPAAGRPRTQSCSAAF